MMVHIPHLDGPIVAAKGERNQRLPRRLHIGVDMYTSTTYDMYTSTAEGVMGKANAISAAVRNSSTWTASGVVHALELVWARIRERHEDLPEAVLVVASGTEATNVQRWGHWGAGRWRVTAEGNTVGEVLIAGERLRNGPAAVLETLLHEGAHALAFARGIKDCSRGGRYHNERYKLLAEELGLTVKRDRVYGWTLTDLADGTGELYRAELGALEVAIGRAYRRAVEEIAAGDGQADPGDAGGATGTDAGAGDAGTAGKRWRLACSCPEPRLVRMSRAVALVGPISCGACGSIFLGPELAAAVIALDDAGEAPAPWAATMDTVRKAAST
jgi:hypothetical protein